MLYWEIVTLTAVIYTAIDVPYMLSFGLEIPGRSMYFLLYVIWVLCLLHATCVYRCVYIILMLCAL